jgi:hypothetical protein
MRFVMRVLSWLPAVPIVAALMLASLSSPAQAAFSAFAVQKIFDMTVTAVPGSAATISGDSLGFSVKMSTDAAIRAIGNGIACNGGLGGLQAYATPSLPAAPVENHSGPSLADFSMPPGERALLESVPTEAAIPKGLSQWAVTGFFENNRITAHRAAASLDFNVAGRLAVFSAPFNDNKAEACNRIALDIFDAAGDSTFDSIPGANPLSTRLLPSISSFAETYNDATSIRSHLYPGRDVVTIQTLPLGPGRGTYEIKGPSTAHAVEPPELSAAAALGSAAALLAAMGGRRNRRIHQIG